MEAPQKILLVEDDELHIELIRKTLALRMPEITLIIAKTLAEAKRLLKAQANTFNLVITDLKLSDGQGTELLLKNKNLYPVVVMTGYGDEKIAVEAIKSGALDYIVKSMETLKRIPHIVKRSLREWENITQRKQMEQALLESEQRYRQMFQQNLALKLLIDSQWKIIDANSSACSFYGYNIEKIKEKSFFDLCTPSSAVILKEKTKTEIEQLNGVTFAHVTSSEQLRDVRVYSGPIDINNKRFIYFVIYDITDKKLLQQELLKISEREQHNIAHDLHDSLGQILTGIKFLSHGLKKRLESQLPKEADSANKIENLVNQSIQYTKNLAKGLHPLEDGLCNTIQRLAKQISEVFQVSCLFEHDMDFDLPNDDSMQLYRIVQEAINNGIKHGKADTFLIKLGIHKNQITLSIYDNGIGFPEKLSKNTGMGLNIMRYRCEMIDAVLDIKRGESKGTIVVVRLDLKNRVQL